MSDNVPQTIPLPHGGSEMAVRIRDFAWQNTPLGPIETWPHTLRTAVDLMLASPQPVYIGWGADLISLYNDGYIAIAGAKHPRSLGQPYRKMWAEIWGEIRPVIESTMAGESHIFYDRPLPVAGRPDRPMSWFTTTATPIRDEAGKPAGFMTVALETTERVLAEASLQQKFEVLFNAIDEGLAIVEMIYDADGEIVDMIFRQVNAAYERQGGISNVIGRSVVEMLPGVESIWLDRYKQVARTGVALRVEDHQQDVDRWFDVFFTRIDQDGRFVAIVFNDITDRKRREIALRESEERFRQFADASASGLWIRDAATLGMEYASPAVEAIYGLEPDALLGDVTRWAGMIVPEDRDAALRHLEEARGGRTAIHEFRIQRASDQVFRWIRNTDFPLHDDDQVERVGGIAEDITEARLAVEHQGVLLAELQHRVRNIMAIIRSITARTGERARDVEEYRSLMAGRLLALARVQALLTRAANVSVGIRGIVQDEVSAQAQHEGQYVLDGPDVTISPKAAEVLTLAVHELATNALKYGALSVPDGKVTVSWHVFEKRGVPWLMFDWSEDGAPERPQPAADVPRRTGFGSELIEGRVPYELGGKGKITIEPGGAHCHLEFPLKEGASVLETGAPQQAMVFGGALDMTGETGLSGNTILVMEDDFYLATDTARALKSAGADVIGPCSSEDAAFDAIEDDTPTGAVVDINLGPGPSFEMARALRKRGVPFIFVTGYDEDVIPSEFDGVTRLQKPVDLKHIVRALAEVLDEAA